MSILLGMKMLRGFLYDFVLFWIGLFLLFRKRTLSTLFGWGIPTPKKRPLIWIHAVSVGETKAVAPLAQALQQQHPNATFLLSSITKTGHEEAKRSVSFADHHIFLPLDISWIIRPIVKRLRPHLLLISETDLWPNFLSEAKNCGAKIVLVNGKLSKRSQKRLQRFPSFARELVRPIDLFCVQSATYAARFATMGVKKCHVLGNLKCDAPCPRLTESEKAAWRVSLGLGGAQVIVVGSSHDPEERLLLPVFCKLWKAYPTVKVLFVPRHPERFDAVFALLQKEGIATTRYTQKEKVEAQAIVIDAMGVLSCCYQLADIALVGGSFIPHVGGHNILEPAAYGVPTFFGPHMYAQPDLVALMVEHRAGEQVSLSELEEKLPFFLESAEERKAMGQRGMQLAEEMRGATSRTLEQILVEV